MGNNRLWNPSKEGATPSDEIAELAEAHTFASVLDVGCGWGRNIAVFAGTAKVLHAFDLDPSGVLATRRRLGESSAEAAEVDVWTDDLLEAEIGRTYDLVICYGVTHFLRRRQRLAAYDRLQSWTGPGGVLAIASFNAVTPIPPDLRDLMPEPPQDSAELHDRYAGWPVVLSRSYTYDDEHEGGRIKHTHSIDRLIVRAP